MPDTLSSLDPIPADCSPPDKRAPASNALMNRPEQTLYILRASGSQLDSPAAANLPSLVVFALLPAAGPDESPTANVFRHPLHFRRAVTREPNPHAPSPIAAETQVRLRTPAPPRRYGLPAEALYRWPGESLGDPASDGEQRDIPRLPLHCAAQPPVNRQVPHAPGKNPALPLRSVRTSLLRAIRIRALFG